MAENNRPSINLLPNKGGGFFNIFLNWAVNIGRLLIILTETVALATFLYRFNLDMKIVDLHDQIKQRSFIVKNFKTYEASFRDLQTRLALAKEHDSSGQKSLSILKDIVEMGRGKVTFRNILIATKTVKIEAQATSPSAISQFVAALKSYPQVTSVTVENVQDSTVNAQIVVSITAMVAGVPEGQKTTIKSIQQNQGF